MSKSRLIKILKLVIPLGLGFYLIWYSLSSATPTERHTLWENIKNANPIWIGISLLCGILSHLSRAYRWQFLLQPLGYAPSLKNRFLAIMAGYLANLGIPRSGEILRGATLTTYEHVPFEKSFGTIISERVADVLMLLLVIGVAFLFQTELLLSYIHKIDINPLFIAVGLITLGAAGFLVIRLLKTAKNPLLQKINGFVKGLLEGVKSILHMENKGAFILHTLFIWIMYVLMFYVVKYAVPDVDILPFGVILGAFVVGTFSITATNGGIGIYPIALGAYFTLYGITKESGEAFGWIVWSTQTALVVILGALSFIALPLLNSKSVADPNTRNN